MAAVATSMAATRKVHRSPLNCILAVALAALHPPEFASAFEFSGFRMGMSEADALGAARRHGYQMRPIGSGYSWEGSSGSGTVSLCNGKVFAANSTFDANFHSFIGLVRERQNQYGEPHWKVDQSYSVEGKQLSRLEAQWDDLIGRFQPSVSMFFYGGAADMSKPRVTISYSGHKYMCSSGGAK
jgi:hypothetical protein